MPQPPLSFMDCELCSASFRDTTGTTECTIHEPHTVTLYLPYEISWAQVGEHTCDHSGHDEPASFSIAHNLVGVGAYTIHVNILQFMQWRCRGANGPSCCICLPAMSESSRLSIIPAITIILQVSFRSTASRQE